MQKKLFAIAATTWDNDPNFTDKSFQEYWEQIEHHGKD